MNESTDITVGSPARFDSGMELMSVADQSKVLAEYSDRRDAFRKWLLGKLEQGIHYGFPPGCRAKLDKDGNIIHHNSDTGRDEVIPRKQWRAKPSLYKSGALYLKDLLKLRDEYSSDLEAWKMLGEPKGIFVRRCRLYSGERAIGEGTGCYKVGVRKMDENSAIKMADKRALVASIINTLATCADLFTQDRDEVPPVSPSDIVQPTMEDDDEASKKSFNALAQKWVEETIPVYKMTSKDIDRLRSQLTIWRKGNLPQSATEAVGWMREKAKVSARINETGEVTGVKFELKNTE